MLKIQEDIHGTLTLLPGNNLIIPFCMHGTLTLERRRILSLNLLHRSIASDRP